MGFVRPWLVHARLAPETGGRFTHTCVRIMRDTAFNETIEKMCSFKGDVSERFKDTFKKRKCVSKVNQAEQDRIKAEVYANTTEQKNMVGLKDFCLVHKSAYHNL